MEPKIGIYILFYLLKFLNLIPFSLNLKNFDTKPSKKSILYSIVFFVLLFVHHIFIGDFAFKLNSDYHVNHPRYRDLFIPTYTIIVICITWTIFTNKLSFKLIERSKLIIHRINGLGVPWKCQQKINKILFNFSFFQLCSLILDYTFLFSYGKMSIAMIIFYTPLLALQFAYLSVILMKNYMMIILLKSLFSQVNKIINEKFVKTTNFENEAEAIDELAKIYSTLCEMYVMITKLLSIPLILVVGYVLIIIESVLLLLYGNFIESLGLPTLFRSFMMCLWLFVKIRDVYLVFKNGTGVLKMVSKK